MGLIYDSPDLAALTLTRLAAEESEGPGALEGRMLNYLDGLEQRNGTAYVELLVITLARVHFKSLDGPGPPATIRQHCWTPPRLRRWTASMAAARPLSGSGLPAASSRR